MSSPTDTFTKNKFIDKVMKWIPEDPLTQSKFMYYLTCVVFLGLLGYGLNAWYNFFAHSFQLSYLFSGLFMIAIALISSFGLKQTRSNYILVKQMYSMPKQEMKVESIGEMKEEFKDAKVQDNKSK